jgi:hypothetical protein
MRTALLLVALACLPALLGCGGGQTRAAPLNQSNRRQAALDCLQHQKRLLARPVGIDRIQVGDARTGPRVSFFLTGGVAQADQFEGREEGSEQIGAALLFPRGGSEKLLDKVEDCLDHL